MYAQDRGEKGSLTWQPVPKIVDALDAAFYATFQNVEPCGKPVLLALDVSGSMDASMIAGSCLSAREASAAIALARIFHTRSRNRLQKRDSAQHWRGIFSFWASKGLPTVCQAFLARLRALGRGICFLSARPEIKFTSSSVC